jgi:hypothetical protein
MDTYLFVIHFWSVTETSTHHRILLECVIACAFSEKKMTSEVAKRKFGFRYMPPEMLNYNPAVRWHLEANTK